MEIASRSIAVVPAGAFQLHLPRGARAFALTTARRDMDSRNVVNADDYKVLDGRVIPVAKPMVRLEKDADRIRVYQVDDIPFPKEIPG